jgi:hypothetical protein
MMHQAFVFSSCMIALVGSLLLIVEPSKAFSTNSIHKRTFGTATSLKVSSSVRIMEDEARQRMDKARECAFSDSCSIDEVRDHLQDILTIQSGCVSGVIAGSDLCENQDAAAEIVAHLREKLGSTSYVQKTTSSTSVMSNGLMSTAVLALFFIAISTFKNANVTPFTPEEWWWAAKDGYLDDMIAHYIRNGGL